MRLSLQADLAVNYFALLGLDAQKQLLDFIIAAFERAVTLTTNRYNQGVAAQIEVLQARTQLEITRAQAIDVGVQRAQFEHAIAILIGKLPAEFTIPPVLFPVRRPDIPAGFPVQPADIPGGLPAHAATAYPNGSALGTLRTPARHCGYGAPRGGGKCAGGHCTNGVLSHGDLDGGSRAGKLSLTNLFSLPSVFWSVGSTVAQIIFDAGRRKAVAEQAQAAYDATVATYRQTVLTAFQVSKTTWQPCAFSRRKRSNRTKR